MSVLQCPDGFNAPELQIWNNAAFDNGESENSAAIKASWSNLQSVYVNRSLESDCSKENHSPVLIKSPVPLKSAVPIKPLHTHNVLQNSQGKPLKGSFEAFQAKPKNGKGKDGDEEKRRNQRNIDVEIEEIEKEISRLSSRLEALRLEKAEDNVMRGRIIPAKFMEQKQSFKILDSMIKMEDSLLSNSKTKTNRRGVSLGPAEIFTAVKSRQQGKQEMITPVQSIQSRRKSCFWKLQHIDEENVTKERGKSLSLSPKSRKTAAKIQSQKQAATTVGSKRSMKKEGGVLATIQPKKLFIDGEKTVTAKKPLKPGRVVASRYSQINNQPNGNLSDNDARKRSLPENDKEESNRGDKIRTSRENGADSCRNQKTESRVKKRWEIPTQVVVYKSVVEEESSPPYVSKIRRELPEIKNLRCVAESPRDSGAAKRVADLVGRKPYFCIHEEAGDSVFQALSFAVEDFDEE